MVARSADSTMHDANTHLLFVFSISCRDRDYTVQTTCLCPENVLLIAFVRLFFFFNDTAFTEIYTLSLHDALPICSRVRPGARRRAHDRNGCAPLRNPIL